MATVHVFDLYGTLIDLGSALGAGARSADPGLVRQINDTWRAKQLEFAWVAALTGSYTPFSALTERALDVSLASHGQQENGPLRRALLETYAEARAYPEVSAVLRALRAQGDQCVVLSNGDPDMLVAALMASGLSSAFDRVISVHPVQQFKPAPAAYQYAENTLSVTRGSIRFYSSNPWDVFGATCFGWRTTWVNRKGGGFEYNTPPTDGWVSDLADLTVTRADAKQCPPPAMNLQT